MDYKLRHMIDLDNINCLDLLEKNTDYLFKNQIIYKILKTKLLKSPDTIEKYNFKYFLNEIKYLSVDKIAEYLYFQKQEIIEYFYYEFKKYLEENDDIQAEKLFAIIKTNISDILKKQLKISSNTEEVVINNVKFVVDFNTLRIYTYDVIRNKIYQTYLMSKFKFIEIMFCNIQNLIINVNAEKTENGYIIKWVYSNGYHFNQEIELK